jgi:hypothetical protein
MITENQVLISAHFKAGRLSFPIKRGLMTLRMYAMDMVVMDMLRIHKMTYFVDLPAVDFVTWDSDQISAQQRGP